MTDIKLIATDIDDTLLTSHGVISPATVAALKTALAAGIKVVPCSGRPLAGVRRYMDTLGIDGDEQYAITFNGGVVETAGGTVIQTLSLSNDLYRRLDSFSTTEKAGYYVLDSASTVFTSNKDVDRFTVVQAWENRAGLYIRIPDEMPADFTPVKAAFVGSTAELDRIEPAVLAAFGDEAYIVRAGKNFLEIMNKDAGKGNGLRALTAALNLTPDQVLVFGDEKNDLPMFDFAGTAVAMGNGSDLAKSHADYVTSSNDEDGIAAALKHLEII